MDAKELLEDFISGDPDKVISASNAIISRCNDRDLIAPLLDHLTEINKKIKHLDLGGKLAPNKRFVNHALRIIRFYKSGKACPCSLYPYSGYDGYDPENEQDKNNIRITSTTTEAMSTTYIVECMKCGEKYSVLGLERHYKFWKWSELK